MHQPDGKPIGSLPARSVVRTQWWSEDHPFHMIVNRRIRAVLRQIAECVVLHYRDLMTRYGRHIRNEEPIVRSVRSGRASLVEHAERTHVFVSSVVDRTADALVGQERTIRFGAMPLTPAVRGECIDLDEGRRW